MPIVLVSLPILTAECVDTKRIRVEQARRKFQWQSIEATGTRRDSEKIEYGGVEWWKHWAMKDEQLAEVARRRVLRLTSSIPLWAKNFLNSKSLLLSNLLSGLYLRTSTTTHTYTSNRKWTYNNQPRHLFYATIGSYLTMAGSPNSNLRGFNHAVHTLLKQPTQFLPHLTIPTFTHLPEDLGPHLVRTREPSNKDPSNPQTEKPTPPTRTPTIHALVLDKDNTLCPPKTTTFPPQILSKLTALRTSPTSPFNQSRNPHGILIVSNRAGSHPRYDAEIQSLESQLSHLSIPVFRLPPGTDKKPFCGEEVVRWFRERGVVKGPGEIAVVGDRLGTDVLMAVGMGSWSVWCKEGVFEEGEVGKPKRNVLERMEVWIERYLREGRGCTAPVPRGWEE